MIVSDRTPRRITDSDWVPAPHPESRRHSRGVLCPFHVTSRFPPSSDRPRPPWFLLAAMVMTWFIGMYGVSAGCETVAYLRAGNMPEAVSATTQAKDVRELISVSKRRAIAEARERTLPLAVGEALLSLVLVVGSVLAMAGRKGGRSFVTQALVANAAFLVVDYALTRNVRGTYIAEVAQAGPELFSRKQDHTASLDQLLWWSERIKLVLLDLGSLGIAFIAVRATRSRAYFEAAIRAQEQAATDNDEDS